MNGRKNDAPKARDVLSSSPEPVNIVRYMVEKERQLQVALRLLVS